MKHNIVIIKHYNIQLYGNLILFIINLLDYISKYNIFLKNLRMFLHMFFLLLSLDVAINAALMTTRNRKCNNINKIWKTRIFILQNQLIAATIKEITFFFASVKNIFLDGRDTFASGLLIQSLQKLYILWTEAQLHQNYVHQLQKCFIFYRNTEQNPL